MCQNDPVHFVIDSLLLRRQRFISISMRHFGIRCFIFRAYLCTLCRLFLCRTGICFCFRIFLFYTDLVCDFFRKHTCILKHSGILNHSARWEFDLKAVYGVFFMNFRLEDTPHKLRTDIVLSDRDTHEVFSDKLRFIFIELPSFNKEEEECETDFERWIYILKNMETLNRLPFKARKAVFEKLEKIVDIASLSKEERMKYDESIKVYRDNLATISFAENKGLKRGREEGLKEGIEKGLKEGRKEGILSVARNLRSGGMSVEAIAAATGLSIEEIEQLD